MDLASIIQSQLLASLKMLKQAITLCPDEMWDAPEDRNRFWHIAYHALFYAHLYIHQDMSHFVLWENHRENYNYMGDVAWDPSKKPVLDQPYTKGEILAYWEFVAQEVARIVPTLDLTAAESGFEWLPISKMEHQVYNIRHTMLHTGDLAERLGARAGIDVDWVGVNK